MNDQDRDFELNLSLFLLPLLLLLLFLQKVQARVDVRRNWISFNEWFVDCCDECVSKVEGELDD